MTLNPQRREALGQEDIFTLFTDSQLTPQEAADQSGLHINTVKKILKGDRVHPNSRTKLQRALVLAANSVSAEVTQLKDHLDGNGASDKGIAQSFEELIETLNSFLVLAREDPRAFHEVNVDAAFVDLDTVEGIINTIARAQKRLT